MVENVCFFYNTERLIVTFRFYFQQLTVAYLEIKHNTANICHIFHFSNPEKDFTLE